MLGEEFLEGLLHNGFGPRGSLPQPLVVLFEKYGTSLLRVERMRGDQFPLLGVDLEPDPLGDSYPDRCAGIVMGDRVSAPIEGDERIPAHFAEGLLCGDKSSWWERDEVGSLGFESVNGSLSGGSMYPDIQLVSFEAVKLLQKMVKALEASPLDEVVLQVEEGSFHLSLRLGSSDFTGDGLKPIMSAELKKPGVPLKMWPRSEDKRLGVVYHDRLGHTTEVMEALFQSLEDSPLVFIEAGTVVLPAAV